MANQGTLFRRENSSPIKDCYEHQEDAIEAIFDYFSEKDGSPIVVVPVAGGKSLIMAEFMKRANKYFPNTRFISVTHVSELLKQNASELANQWPEADFSFYCDALNAKDMSGDIIFASIQSIYEKAYELPNVPDLILVDEAHLIPNDDSTMYRKFLTDMQTVNPHVKIIGFTGTPFRTDGGYLHKGKNALFTDIAYEISILELINRKHLCSMVAPDGGVKTKMDTTGVKKAGGDFITSQLAKAVDDEDITRACVDEIMQYGENRRKWIVFTVNIEHCGHVTQEIRSRGIECDMVHSKRSNAENAAVIESFRNGRLHCLINVAKLTTGFNVPSIDLMAFMRPTRSPVLYVQMAGRGMRIFAGKENCLLLDFGGVVETLGPIDQIHIPEKKGEGEGDAPVKTCEHCGCVCAAGMRVCPNCGAEFPESGLNIDANPSQAAVLSTQMKSIEYTVSRIGYYRHQKEGKPDSMRAEYLCGMEKYREWVCFEHTRTPREEACQWWLQRSPKTMAPNTVTEALDRVKELAKPKTIKVRKIGKYYQVVGWTF